MAICAKDILFWINVFGVQFNPKLRETGPFITWPYQDVAICGGETMIGGEKRFQHGVLACVEDQKDCRWPKSREGGATWIALFVVVWLGLFQRNIKATAISRTEAAVKEVDDSDSLFEKVKVMLAHCPDWMKTGVRQKKGSVTFERTNSAFTGSANVESAGVGGRTTITVIDEFGQFDKNGEAIYDFTSDTAGCRLFIFTHKDNSGMAYKLCYDPKFVNMREIMTHWSQHPLKNPGLYRYDEATNDVVILDPDWHSGKYKYPTKFEFVREARPTGGPCPGIRSPWYDSETMDRRNERDVRMNLDIDPRGSTDRFFDNYLIRTLQNRHCRPPVWTGTLHYNKMTGTVERLAHDADGLIKLWVMPKSEREMPRIRAGAGVDISSGTGYSASCLSVWNAVTGEKFLEYQNGDIFEPDLAVFVYAMLSMIRDDRGVRPTLVWEKQFGGVFKKRIVDQMHYSPVWMPRDEAIIGRPKSQILKPGWNVSQPSILALMEEYRELLYQERVVNRSRESLDECLQLQYTSKGVEYRAEGKRQEDGSGAGVHHGDILRADGLGVMVIKDMGFETPLAKVELDEYADPRTFDGRMKLHERAEEEELVWN